MVAAIYDGTGAYTSAWILLFILTIVTLVGWIGSYALSRKYVEK
jgi:OFA family oxalate/formate antiporter-like MFS transporter